MLADESNLVSDPSGTDEHDDELPNQVSIGMVQQSAVDELFDGVDARNAEEENGTVGGAGEHHFDDNSVMDDTK